MNTNRALKTWAAVIGIGIGGLPFLPRALNPPTPWLIILGPLLMPGLAYYAAAVYLSQKTPITFWKKIGVGISMAVAFVLLAAIGMGILIGNEWWAWAFVIVTFALLGAVPIGALLGWMGASYIDGVSTGRRSPSTDIRHISLAALVLCSIFIGIPGAIWWVQH